MKLSLLSVFEGFFHPELPSAANAHRFNTMKSKTDFGHEPQDELPDTFDEEEIDKELKLELKLGNIMKDPTNLPGHNSYNGSFSNGKGQSFGNFKTNNKFNDDADAMAVRTYEVDNSHIEENVGAREKAGTESDFQTTKKPFANGIPKKTNIDFLTDEEISRELGLAEWINSSTITGRHLHGAKDDLNFFNTKLNSYLMNTEEEFDENQKKRIDVKKKKTKNRA